MNKLNLGCENIRNGYVNLDNGSLPSVDVVHHIESGSLSSANETFD